MTSIKKTAGRSRPWRPEQGDRVRIKSGVDRFEGSTDGYFDGLVGTIAKTIPVVLVRFDGGIGLWEFMNSEMELIQAPLRNVEPMMSEPGRCLWSEQDDE